jgi:hypothetical protein
MSDRKRKLPNTKIKRKRARKEERERESEVFARPVKRSLRRGRGN